MLPSSESCREIHRRNTWCVCTNTRCGTDDGVLTDLSDGVSILGVNLSDGADLFAVVERLQQVGVPQLVDVGHRHLEGVDASLRAQLRHLISDLDEKRTELQTIKGTGEPVLICMIC